MSRNRTATSPRDTLWILALAVGLPLLAMFLLGVDANWDLRNYHLYNVHAWLAGRSQDVAPAMLQTWHNPLLDLPLYLLFTSGLAVRWASAWLTVPTIFAIGFLLMMQRALSPAPVSRTSQVVLALLALTGAATYSTLATSTNDAFVAAAMLGALLLVAGQSPATHWRWLSAGLVAGAITGLKLTASFYCIALALAALVEGGSRDRVLRVCSLAIGGVAGFAITYGWWAWRLAHAFGNPFFPYYNNVFRSPMAPQETFADARFRPDSAIDGLLAPLRLVARSTRFSELPLSDPRLLLGLLSFAGLVLLYRRRQTAPALASKLGMLTVFFIAAFLFWIMQYGIYRYALVLEMLGSLALVLLVTEVPRWKPVALVAALLLVSADTKRPDWGHLASMAPRAGMHAAPLPANAMVVTVEDEPLAYMALALPDRVPFVGLGTNIVRSGGCTGLKLLAEQILAAHTGPVWLLSTRPLTDADLPRRMAQADFGLYDSGECITYPSELGAPQLCRQERRPVAALCSGSAMPGAAANGPAPAAASPAH